MPAPTTAASTIAASNALREGRPPVDAKLAALSTLARNLIETRGHVDTTLVDTFLAAGYRRDQVLEVDHQRGVDDHELHRGPRAPSSRRAARGARLEGHVTVAVASP